MGQHPHGAAGRIGTLSRRPHGRGPAAPGTGGVMTIAADLARALDPVLLAEQAGLVPDPWQAQVLRSTAARVLLLCSRQAGKSTITSILAVHSALYDPGALV